MNSECLRISDQLRRAFAGDPWHGSPIRELLNGITAEQASVRPLRSGHTIWELVLHIDAYVHAAAEVIQGVPMPRLFGTEKDWPAAREHSPAVWSEDVERLFRDGDRLAQSIGELSDSYLQKVVPGRDYDFYYLFHGIVQHSLYHGGQIAMLKKAIPDR